ncbi:hypothetical protein [Candidatus Nitrosocosmicus sp. SS]|jgi:hypothetical protein|uniref:hypothetical protein n=1 Tax=Candidatus Nitrosocosmicus agrestis TaxID=2563600 RepID=UPI00122E52C9|nr:hypothetical protein [Candidatus Nitrosocosmicus sp. SS]KAA2282496.1 hypothetical protein F1Z66_06330 [Candidatus Nitrosocosmicus sp. SS]KAF0868762.1 hypothetical protein E5N71_08765 [Candidatus Nitrosocosmicus sp. SS]MDR4489649.1 hypothetical protein [Candidatus Nitrosocosmicus sp.]
MITQLETNSNVQPIHHHTPSRHEPNQIPYTASHNYEPVIPKAGQPTLITIQINKNQTEKRIKKFDLVHEKLMHVIIVSEDLSYFSHIHPIFDDNEGKFTVFHQFPATGKYKIWVDFKPKNGNQTLVTFKLDNMIGNAYKPTYITKGRQFIKQVDKDHKVKLIIPKEIKSNKVINIEFVILDQNSKPITNLTPLMGAGDHSVIINSNLKEFLHVHPNEEVSSSWKGGPAITFSTVFPYPGLYKVWGQFQHQNEVVTADFVLEVT